MFDSVADRCSELAVVLGAILGGIIYPIGILAIIGSTALLSMRVVSHLQGLDSSYVLFGRAERIVCISPWPYRPMFTPGHHLFRRSWIAAHDLILVNS